MGLTSQRFAGYAMVRLRETCLGAPLSPGSQEEKGMDGRIGATPPGSLAFLSVPGLWPVEEGWVFASL